MAAAAVRSLAARAKRVGFGWLLLAPLIWLLPGIDGYPYPGGGALFSDLAISHDPNAFFLRRSLLEHRAIPFWSPSILSGTPFAADPLAGLFYPPGWLALVLPLPLGFNLLAATHLIFGGWGAYRLLRAEGTGREAAWLGGLAFAALPKLYAHFGAGHATLLMAVPWTPWLLLAQRQGGLRLRLGSWRFRLPAGVLLALIFLADVRWAAYAGVLWLAYGLFGSPGSIFGRGRTVWWGALKDLSFQVLLAFLLAAPLALPLAEFVRLSTRSGMHSGEVLEISLPAARLLGLFFPDFGGAHEWMLYPGAGILALALAGLQWRPARRSGRFWWPVAGLALLYALGASLPGLDLLARLPGFNLLRVPPRTLFLLGLALAVLASHGLDHLLNGLSAPEVRRAALLLVALAGFIISLSAGVIALTGSAGKPFNWGAGVWFASAAWLLFGMRRKPAGRVWLLGWLALCLVDLGAVDYSLFRYRPASEVLAEGQAAAAFLAGQEGQFRVYSPSYSLPQQTAARYNLELADGVNPLQLAGYVRFMESATGVPVDGYSVTLPPFSGGDPRADNRAYHPDPQLLGMLNVRYVASEFDLDVEGLALRRRFGQTRVYENRYARPRAWQQPSGPGGAEDWGPVEVVEWTPNRIELQVPESASPAGEIPAGRRVILAELDYPGWQAYLDGQRTAIQTEEGILRSIVVPPGAKRIVLVFRPTMLYIGVALAMLGLAILAYRQRAAGRFFVE